MIFKFSDSLLIAAPRDAVYTQLWEVRRWPELLPHVISVEVLEERPGYHRFRMKTHGEAGTSTTESMRESHSRDCISYEQIIRPPLLRMHHGRWLLEQEEAGVRVTSEHSVEIEPGEICSALGRDYSVKEAELLVRRFVGNHSVKTLTSIRNALANPENTNQAKSHG